MGWMVMPHLRRDRIHNLDMAAFFAKWSVDIRDAQTPEGAYSDVSPNPVMGKNQFISVPGWGDAGVAIPFHMYRHYGDTRLLAEHYESARKWIDYIRAKNPNLIWEKARGNDYGDWLNADTLKLEGSPSKGAEVPKEIFATVCFESSTRMVAKMAAALGKADEPSSTAPSPTRSATSSAGGSLPRMASSRRHAGRVRLRAPLQPGSRIAPPRDGPAPPERIQTRRSPLHRLPSTIPMMDELVRTGHADIAYRLVTSTSSQLGLHDRAGRHNRVERWDGYIKGRKGSGASSRTPA